MSISTSTISSKAKWKEFFTRYYKPRIQLIAVSNAKAKYLDVDFNHLVRFDVRLAEDLISDPDRVLKDAESALPLVDLPVSRKASALVRIVKLPGKTMIRDLRGSHVNTLVSIDCTVRNITGVIQRIRVGAFECARCGNIVYLPQESSGKFIEPGYCTCNEEKRGVFRLLFKESTFEDYQRIKIQESLEDLNGGEQPQSIEANLSNDLAGALTPGDRIVLNGIMRSVQKAKKDGKSIYFDYYLDANGFERDEEELDELEITPDDEARIREHASAEDVFERIERSIAPSIYGHGHVKRAVGLQLFGGMLKRLPDGARIRGDIHVLWLGDPAVAKSQVLTYASDLAPRGMYTSGQGASAAGLTAATVPDEFSGGSYVLEAGSMVLADRGLCCIDEIDKMREDDRKKIHGAMEQQVVTVDRAGIHATMRCECSILAAGNPIGGRWDPDESITKQIKLDPAILSRFDLIFLSRDLPDEALDKKISGHILNAHRMGDLKEITPVVDPLLLKKWIALAKRTAFPKMTDRVMGRIQEYYLGKRKASEKSSIKVTARDLDGLVRLCEAAARIRLSPTIEDRDVDEVLRLKEKSVEDTCIDENGEVDIDKITVDMTKAQRDRLAAIRNTIKALSGNQKNNTVSIGAVIEECESRKIPGETVEKELERLKEIGQVWITEDGQRVMLT